MKIFALISILISVLFVNQNSFSQCNVSSDILEDGTICYLHSKEKLYVNEDLQNGILIAYGQLVVMQHPVDKNMLQFVMFIIVGRSGSKQMIVPRQIKIYFTDGTTIELIAEKLNNPSMLGTVYTQQSTFRLNTDYYLTLQKKSLTEIVIIDNRESIQLTCRPYKDILKEQANCIALKL